MIDVVYARAADGTNVAYRVFDADPSVETAHDVVMVPGGLIPLELFEEEAGFARLLDGLRSLGRVIVFDRRGVGLSDPITSPSHPPVVGRRIPSHRTRTRRHTSCGGYEPRQPCA